MFKCFGAEASLSRGKGRQSLKILVTDKSDYFFVLLLESVVSVLICVPSALHSDRTGHVSTHGQSQGCRGGRTRIHPLGGGLRKLRSLEWEG
jgi:hypothetical protein